MSNRFRDVTCNANLDRKGRANVLEDCVTCTAGNSVSPKMMATAVEAIVGALFEDSHGDLRVIRQGMMALGLLDA